MSFTHGFGGWTWGQSLHPVKPKRFKNSWEPYTLIGVKTFKYTVSLLFSIHHLLKGKFDCETEIRTETEILVTYM